MVIDTSALISMLLAEVDADAFARAIKNAGRARISTATYAELRIVALTRRPDRREFASRTIRNLELEIVPLTREHADLAADAYERYGKGRHPAALNFGDCFAYALAKALDAPLLFKGTDFGRTDVTPVELGPT